MKPRPRTIPIADLAFAYELVKSGVCYKLAALAIGVDSHIALKCAIYRAEKHGLGLTR
jgi:hypothetical protein